MSIRIIFLLISITLVLRTSVSTYMPKVIDKINVKYPGFVTFIPSNDVKTHHLVITSFEGAPFTPDHVFYVPNYTGSTPPKQILELSNQNVIWPNEATFTNKSIINEKIDKFGGIIVPSGFLVPTKDNGGVFYYPFESADRSLVSDRPPIKLTTKAQPNHWFYHRVKLVDLSGDGTNDLLTCRTYKPVVGKTKTQLVGLVLNTQTLEFEEKLVIDEACDVFFEVADIDADGRFEIIAAGFFIAELNLIYSDDPKNSFLTGKVQVKTIDLSGDKFFDVKVADLDMLKPTVFELLVTNHQGNKDEIKSSLYYYKLNGANFRTGNWTRTTIHDSFPVIKGGIQAASPGSALAFHPNVRSANSTRPYLLVAGDGAENIYLFEPSPTGQQLNYNLIWSQDFKDTVGGITIADINNDGVNEFAVAVYEKNVCFVYTLVSS